MWSGTGGNSDSEDEVEICELASDEACEDVVTMVVNCWYTMYVGVDSERIRDGERAHAVGLGWWFMRPDNERASLSTDLGTASALAT